MTKYRPCAMCGQWINLDNDRYAKIEMNGADPLYLHDALCRERYCLNYEVPMQMVKIHRKRTRLVDPDAVYGGGS